MAAKYEELDPISSFLLHIIQKQNVKIALPLLSKFKNESIGKKEEEEEEEVNGITKNQNNNNNNWCQRTYICPSPYCESRDKIIKAGDTPYFRIASIEERNNSVCLKKDDYKRRPKKLPVSSLSFDKQDSQAICGLCEYNFLSNDDDDSAMKNTFQFQFQEDNQKLHRKIYKMKCSHIFCSWCIPFENIDFHNNDNNNTPSFWPQWAVCPICGLEENIPTEISPQELASYLQFRPSISYYHNNTKLNGLKYILDKSKIINNTKPQKVGDGRGRATTIFIFLSSYSDVLRRVKMWLHKNEKIENPFCAFDLEFIESKNVFKARLENYFHFASSSYFFNSEEKCRPNKYLLFTLDFLLSFSENIWDKKLISLHHYENLQLIFLDFDYTNPKLFYQIIHLLFLPPDTENQKVLFQKDYIFQQGRKEKEKEEEEEEERKHLNLNKKGKLNQKIYFLRLHNSFEEYVGRIFDVSMRKFPSNKKTSTFIPWNFEKEKENKKNSAENENQTNHYKRNRFISSSSSTLLFLNENQEQNKKEKVNESSNIKSFIPNQTKEEQQQHGSKNQINLNQNQQQKEKKQHCSFLESMYQPEIKKEEIIPYQGIQKFKLDQNEEKNVSFFSSSSSILSQSEIESKYDEIIQNIYNKKNNQNNEKQEEEYVFEMFNASFLLEFANVVQYLKEKEITIK